VKSENLGGGKKDPNLVGFQNGWFPWIPGPKYRLTSKHLEKKNLAHPNLETFNRQVYGVEKFNRQVYRVGKCQYVLYAIVYLCFFAKIVVVFPGPFSEAKRRTPCTPFRGDPGLTTFSC
jgi:hypothetical protein